MHASTPPAGDCHLGPHALDRMWCCRPYSSRWVRGGQAENQHSLNHGGRIGAGPDPPTPPTPPTPPPGGQNVGEVPTIIQAKMEELADAAGAGKFLVPCLKGLGKPVTHVRVPTMLSFFSAFSLGPKEGRICAATSVFVATSIFPRHGDKWGQMTFVAH